MKHWKSTFAISKIKRQRHKHALALLPQPARVGLSEGRPTLPRVSKKVSVEQRSR
jgi:hypothetical protein